MYAIRSYYETSLSCYCYYGDENGRYPLHCHTYYEISYIFSGSRTETINNNHCELSDDSLLFIPPLTIHDLRNNTPVNVITSYSIHYTKLYDSWSDVKEIGLIMEHRYHHKKRGGEKYIYFSPHKMTASERYKMILNWPPKKMLSMEYSEKRLEYVMTIWGKELKAYNVEELFPNSED